MPPAAPFFPPLPPPPAPAGGAPPASPAPYPPFGPRSPGGPPAPPAPPSGTPPTDTPPAGAGAAEAAPKGKWSGALKGAGRMFTGLMYLMAFNELMKMGGGMGATEERNKKLTGMLMGASGHISGAMAQGQELAAMQRDVEGTERAADFALEKGRLGASLEREMSQELDALLVGKARILSRASTYSPTVQASLADIAQMGIL